MTWDFEIDNDALKDELVIPFFEDARADVAGDAVRGSPDPAATLRAAGIQALRERAGYIPPQMPNDNVVIQLDLFGGCRLLEFKGETLDYLYDQWVQAADSLWCADLAVGAQVPGAEADIAQCGYELRVIEKLIRLYGGLVPDYDAFSFEQWENL